MKNVLAEGKKCLMAGVLTLSLLLPFTPWLMAAETQFPRIINIGTQPVGSIHHLLDNIVVHPISEKLGITVKAIPFARDRAKYEALREGECFTITISTSGAYQSMRGIDEWDNPTWRPMQLEVIQHTAPSPVVMAVSGDSKINTLYELKGKRISYSPGWPAGRFITVALLAFAGIPEDKVEWISAANYPKGIQMIGNGQVDSAMLTPSTPAAVEVASGPGGLRLLNMPKEDKAGWARFNNEKLPYTYGVWKWGLCSKEPCELVIGSYFRAVMPEQPEGQVYAFVKALYETFPKYKDAQPPDSYFFSLEETLKIAHWEGAGIAFHPGLIKYAKEMGLWTSAHEEYQKKAKKAAKDRMDEWEKRKVKK